MILNNYNIVLEPLQIDKLETVRLWRNKEQVSKFMEFKEEISKEQQITWFQNINPQNEYYFIIQKDAVSIGLIHINKVNREEKNAEVGLFIGESNYAGTGITIGASLNLLDFAFENLNLIEVIAKINNENINAVKYNSFLGFTLSHPLNSDFSLWKLTKEAYEISKPKLVNYI
jgi:UDP-4-amino-4,6-dideoxy-N-acetyl-beta-L-altrosamine N-acetyltransferase